MKGFRPAVNGYYDTDDQLSRYLRTRAEDYFRAHADEQLTTSGEFEERRERVREEFIASIGGLPDRREDVPAETTRTLERDGYAVELLTFESLPNVHVTANCYVPDGEGPHPGILFLCGHVQAAKADAQNQKAAIELARNGFVVLVVDPIGQGERRQYRNPETGEELVGGGGGVFAHCYAGQQCFYAGANLARYFVHDARCGLDYLVGRSDVDEARIGVTGTSGGGIQTQYLALVDDRIDAAAPCCSVTTREEWLKTGKRIDAEQLIYGAISQGIDYDDFLTAMAPRPVCVGATSSDQYFPIEGVREAVERTRGVYDLYDAEENVELVVADERHCSVYEIGQGVFEWFCDQLGDGSFEPHPEEDLAVADESDLHCTPEGSVCEAFPDERTINSLVREYVTENYPNAEEVGDGRNATPDKLRRTNADKLQRTNADKLQRTNADKLQRTNADQLQRTDADQLRRTITEKFDLDRESCDLHPRFVAETEEDGLDVRYVFFKTERDPDVVVTGVLVSDPETSAEYSAEPSVGVSGDTSTGNSAEASAESPAVVLYEEGTDELPERSDEVAALAAEYGTVLVFDPRGVGAVRNREIPIPNWVEEYYGIYGTEFKLAYDALMLDSSLFGMRVFDVLQAIEFLRDGTDSEQVTLVGEGVGAYHALYAAVADERVETIDLRDLGPSFREMATSRQYPYDPRLTVFDVIGDCDVPHCLAALDECDLRVERTRD